MKIVDTIQHLAYCRPLTMGENVQNVKKHSGGFLSFSSINKH